MSKLQGTCKKMQLLNELMDRGGNYVAAALPFVVSLLARGLSRRAQLVAHSLPQTSEVTQLGNDTTSFAACGMSAVSCGTREHLPCTLGKEIGNTESEAVHCVA